MMFKLQRSKAYTGQSKRKDKGSEKKKGKSQSSSTRTLEMNSSSYIPTSHYDQIDYLIKLRQQGRSFDVGNTNHGFAPRKTLIDSYFCVPCNLFFGTSIERETIESCPECSNVSSFHHSGQMNSPV